MTQENHYFLQLIFANKELKNPLLALMAYKLTKQINKKEGFKPRTY